MDIHIHPGRVCATCENCWMRKVPTDFHIREDMPVEFIYDIYCHVDNQSLGELNNQKAELCQNYIERKGVNY